MTLKNIAIGLIFLGGSIAIALLLVYVYKSDIDTTKAIDTEIFSSYGTLVAGTSGVFFSLAGVFLLIATLNTQSKAIQEQQTNFNKQQLNFDKQLFESKFFDLLKIHRENSNDMELKDRKGKKVFLTLIRELKDCMLIIDATNELLPKKWNDREKVNIAYLCFFFGAVGETSEKILSTNFPEYAESFSTIFELFKTSQAGIKKDHYYSHKPFEGHQARLGHYFRHLYQTVKFVDEQKKELLSYNEKYAYIKILRAQLSTQEQAFLFFNSLSDIGSTWEKGFGIHENKQLITKYNLVKNIPTGYTLDIGVRKYYPYVKFEGDDVSVERQRLLDLYSNNN